METAPPPIPQKKRARKRATKLPIQLRARSVPYKKPFLWALLASAAFYLSLVGTAAALFAFMALPGKHTAAILIGFTGFSAILWLLSFFKRRHCHCPLCKGTPLLDNSALCHQKAFRIFPLNYGTSNVLRALTRQHFRCQFCGTPFDLLKSTSAFQDTPQD